MSEHIGKLMLRLMVGGMMLFHGIDKIAHGIGFVKSLVVGAGMPQFFAYGVYVGEFVAPLFVLLGWKSRVWAGVIALNMMMAIYLTQLGAFFHLGSHGSWALELPMFYLLGALCIVSFGSGKYAIKVD